jgi:GTP cyclohydrolase II
VRAFRSAPRQVLDAEASPGSQLRQQRASAASSGSLALVAARKRPLRQMCDAVTVSRSETRPSAPDDRSSHVAWNLNIAELAKRSRLREAASVEVVEKGKRVSYDVTRHGVGPISPADAGVYHCFDFEVRDKWRKYTVLYKGQLDSSFRPVLLEQDMPLMLRIDSGCESGQVFRDTSCECAAQLHDALKMMDEHGFGLLISIPQQDGRGLGLPSKLANFIVQREMGFDTVTSARVIDPLGDVDARTYGGAVAILKFLGLVPGTSIILITNNDRKVSALTDNGYSVTKQGLTTGITAANRRNVAAKGEHFHHAVELPPPIPEDVQDASGNQQADERGDDTT